MTTEIFEIDIATINKLALLAVTSSNQTLLEQTFKKLVPTNLKECLDKAIETNFFTGISFLMQYIKSTDVPKPSDVSKPTEAEPNSSDEKKTICRPLEILESDLFIHTDLNQSVSIGNKNSGLMASIMQMPIDTLRDLNAGIISKKEINHLNSKSLSVLHILCKYAKYIPHSVELIQKIIALGADVNVIDSYDGNYTPLMYACAFQCDLTYKIVTILLQEPTLDLNIKNSFGNTALGLAIMHMGENDKRFIFILNLLRDPRVDVSITNENNFDISQLITKYIKNNTVRQSLWLDFYASAKNPFSITFSPATFRKMSANQKQQLIQLYDDLLPH